MKRFTIVLRAGLMLVTLLTLGACGGGGGGGGGTPAGNGVTGSLQATTLPGAISELASEFPSRIDANVVSALSGYTLSQKDAFPTGGTTTSLWDGQWSQYLNLDGTCYTVEDITVNINCRLTGAPSSAAGGLTLSGVPVSRTNGGSYQGISYANGLIGKGTFKVFYGFKAPVASGNATAVPFALAVVGDVYQNEAYYYSDLKLFVGTITVESSGTSLWLTCSPFNNGPAAPSVFARYTQYSLNIMPWRIGLDYDTVLSPRTTGSVAAAPSVCSPPDTPPPTPSVFNGVCGSSNGSTVATAPTTNLCTSGAASALSGTGPWAWVCQGSNGGANASCLANTSVVNPLSVAGVCGSADGTAVTSAPTNNLCTTGTASVVSVHFGPSWEWDCSGSNGGANMSCAADDPLLNSYPMIAAGQVHTCARTIRGAVKCWGSNGSGQLGDGSTTTRLTPVTVTGFASGLKEIATGATHTCALTNGLGVKCWGSNSNGQLGDGGTTTRLNPVDVSGLTSDVFQIAAGSTHTCAVIRGGTVKCWGSNSNGQLGDGSTTTRLTPVTVTGLTSRVSSISAGSAHTCATIVDGSVKCWGANSDGQLGDGSTTARLTPVTVTGLSSVFSISAGWGHTCAVTNAWLEAKCWGSNSDGQLGDGSTTTRLTPVAVLGLNSQVSGISAGWRYTCALTGNGTKCWGSGSHGQLGNGTLETRLTPIDVWASGLGPPTTGRGPDNVHTCALTSAGGAKCWGDGGDGELGNGTGGNHLPYSQGAPVDVTGFTFF